MIDSKKGEYRVFEDKGDYYLMIYSHESIFVIEDFLRGYKRNCENKINLEFLCELPETGRKMLENAVKH